jgi:hypothetical protein
LGQFVLWVNAGAVGSDLHHYSHPGFHIDYLGDLPHILPAPLAQEPPSSLSRIPQVMSSFAQVSVCNLSSSRLINHHLWGYSLCLGTISGGKEQKMLNYPVCTVNTVHWILLVPKPLQHLDFSTRMPVGHIVFPITKEQGCNT